MSQRPCVNCGAVGSMHRTVPDTCGCGEPLRFAKQEEVPAPRCEDLPPQPPSVITGPSLTGEQRAENERRMRQWHADYAAWRERGALTPAHAEEAARADTALVAELCALAAELHFEDHPGEELGDPRERGGASGLGPVAGAVDLHAGEAPREERAARAPSARGSSGEARADLLAIFDGEEQRRARDAAAAARGARCGGGRDARDMTRLAFTEGWDAALEWLRGGL